MILAKNLQFQHEMYQESGYMYATRNFLILHKRAKLEKF